MITHSSFPAWRIPRTEEPGRQPWDHKELDMTEQLILSTCHKVTAQKGTVGCLHTGSVQFSSVAQLCLTLCDSMNCSTPGLPVHHQHPEFTQTHIHRVSDAIQPFHPLSSPSPPAPNPSQHYSLFQ